VGRVWDLVVVGGGLAGLRAAGLARELGWSCVVLEARSRLGGRVWSVGADDPAVDLGAQWIGPGQHHVAALLRRHRLATVPYSIEGRGVYDDGRRRRLFHGEHPDLGWFESARLGVFRWMLNQRFARLGPGLGGAQRGLAELDRIAASTWLHQWLGAGDAARLMDFTLEASLCLPLARISAFELLQQFASVGSVERIDSAESAIFRGGTGALVSALSGELEHEVVHDAAVRSVEQDRAGVSVRTDRAVFRARHALVCVPPPCPARMRFDPPLPPARARTLTLLQRGHVIKSVLEYDRPWWREDGWSGFVCSRRGVATYVLDGRPDRGDVGRLVVLSCSRAAVRLRKAGGRRQEAIESFLRGALRTRLPRARGFWSLDWNG